LALPEPSRHRLLMTPAALASALQNHQRFVRRQPGGMRAMLRFAQLPGENLTARLLDDADFTGADLGRAVLRQASAARASFYGANLSLADLTLVRAAGADLRGANLCGARLNGSVLDGADMRRAVLASAHDGFQLIRPTEMSVSLNGVDMSEADAGRVDFSHCSLKGARLRGAVFTGAILEGADLTGAQVTGIVFRDAILTGVDVAALNLPPSSLEGCLLDPDGAALAARPAMLAALNAAELWGMTNGREGRPANFDGMDLRVLGNALVGRTLAALSARGAIAAGVSFRGAQLQGSIFEGADLRGADFGEADLRGSNFASAWLSYADLDSANMEPLPLKEGGYKAVDFTRAVTVNVRRLALSAAA
jgi:uncharacterized protein YjbI with pentapeptide repeats